MARLNISIPDSLKAWIDAQVESGTYGNASEYIRDLILKDQRRKEAIAVLQSAIDVGVKSGEASPFDGAAFKLRMRDRRVVP